MRAIWDVILAGEAIMMCGRHVGSFQSPTLKDKIASFCLRNVWINLSLVLKQTE